METLKKLSAILLITIFMSSQALYAGVDTSKLKDTDDKQGIIPLLVAACIAAMTIATCEGKAEQTTSDGTKTSGSIKVEVKK